MLPHLSIEQQKFVVTRRLQPTGGFKKRGFIEGVELSPLFRRGGQSATCGKNTKVLTTISVQKNDVAFLSCTQ